MPTAKSVDDVTIHYDAVGAGAPLVLVHGITDSGADWRQVIDRLSIDHRCITLDLRGHGASADAAEYSPIVMAGDVGAVIDATGAANPVLIGHSLGGVVVTAAAAALPIPIRGVINVDQPLRFRDFKTALAPFADALRGPAFRDVITNMFSAMEGPKLPRAVHEQLAPNRERARQDVVLGVWNTVIDSPEDMLDGLADQLLRMVHAPYLTLLGLDPGPGYGDWLRERMPQVVIERWPDHGHYLHLVDPDRFAERVRAFEKEIDRS